MKGNITISAPTCGTGEEFVEISLKDAMSRTRFVKIKLTYKEFTRVLMGLAETPCDFEVLDLERVGKKKETITLEFPIHGESYSVKREAVFKEAEKACPQGWTPRLYFSSQDSFFQRDGESWARTTASRWMI